MTYRGPTPMANYWIWNEKNLSGNTIDFFVKIVGMSFNQAIRLCKDTAPGRVEIITNLTAYDLPEQHLRNNREIVPASLR